MTATLSIGTVAERTGLAVSAVRYYDEIDLIETAERVGGKRRFDPGTVGRVNFIRRCQDAGLALDEIRRMLDDADGSWRDLVDAKIGDLERRRTELDEMIAFLVEMSDCGCTVVAACPRRGDWC
ncbi:MAG: redox-sensitive transcriptional activator SoxR [Acidimicrobiales bacterium]|nr:MAG: redox-sensitive transcriptional activator SoxR [Acidimicrobiales bacterium]